MNLTSSDYYLKNGTFKIGTFYSGHGYFRNFE